MVAFSWYLVTLISIYSKIVTGFVFDLSFLSPISLGVKDRPNSMFPGTKWCGSGDVAENYDDLGSERETDKCCRDHDYCPDFISAGETKHNLTNNGFFSRVTCECDEAFQQCLKDADTDTSYTVGVTYFNALNTKCFKKAYPVIGCKTYHSLFVTTCLEYEYDTSGEQLYQFFDVKTYDIHQLKIK